MSHTHMLFDYFCDCFLGNIPKIFLKYSSKILLKNILNKKIHTILLRFMLKVWQKISFSKKLKSIYKSFYYLNANMTMFNE
jgi:hypothetical protein